MYSGQVYVIVLPFTLWHFALHYRGNYQYTHPYTSGPTCADCSSACSNKLCSKCSQWAWQGYKSVQGIDLPSSNPPLQQTPAATRTSTPTALNWSSSGAAATATLLPGVLQVHHWDLLISETSTRQVTPVQRNKLRTESCVSLPFSCSSNELQE